MYVYIYMIDRNEQNQSSWALLIDAVLEKYTGKIQHGIIVETDTLYNRYWIYTEDKKTARFIAVFGIEWKT